MSKQQLVQVHCQLIPLLDTEVVFPNTSVAEIINYIEPRPVTGAPPWLLGIIEWRGLSLPLVSLEATAGNPPVPATADSRIAVINATSNLDNQRFFAFMTQGIPHLVKVNHENLSDVVSKDTRGYIQQRAIISNSPAVIPDVDSICSMLAQLNLRFLHT